MSGSEEGHITEWSPGLEEVLRKEGEEAESHFWLHNRSSVVSTRNNDMINIPSIVLQTLTGFLSATGGLVPALVLGSISVFTGVLSTLLSYYKFSAKAEAHRMSAQLYLKIYKKIEIELSLPPDQRVAPLKLLEEVRDKLARVSEVAPDIPQIIIADYKKQFKNGDTKKPIIANGLDKILVYVKPSKEDTPRVNIMVKP
tara:strand:- start:601 stop:1197 length:597 start_codon:yes stop_codon:yes gene_type:complete